ncbi:CRTAC1 family protein [Paludibaculum fermentans]|uniref:CRTAC1 family protein n=1 Tax=Paludibaculum fermentans TaxID=1473598 RepID=A0A7S7SI69_PALFE|nr:CRTAC1 family protein [Paludibaculum fermentans]QOY85131.1 CRTAC1 family protein [Paludibaculum fermentans]
MLRSAWVLPAFLSLAAAQAPPVQFRNAAESAGLKFVLENAASPEKRMIETMAGGLAAFDYNNDGRTDIFFTNGAAYPSNRKADPKYFNRMFRNDGNLKFTDVTAETGLAGEGYGMGASAADYDNDGFVDLFVANVGNSRLYRNLGNGKFKDVTQESGIVDNEWAVAAAWFDYDNDGKLDLWVTHYAKWPPATDRFCGDSQKNIRVYCHPKYFQGLPNRLFHNLGNGKFEDVTKSAGLLVSPGRGMGVAVGDYDADGRMDVFVTNDNEPNSLFHNLGNGKFEEVALIAGVAMMDSGKPVASMGADFRDYDNDGWPDIVVVDLYNETFPLFRNTGKGGFRDATYASGLARLSSKFSGWGPGLADFNLDGWKDLFVSSAHVNDIVEQFEHTEYRQPNRILLNEKGIFRDVSSTAGSDFQVARAHRGLAFADFNQDGLLDAVVSSLNDPAELWINSTITDGEWLIVQLEGVRSNRDGIGARLQWGNQYNVMTTAMGYSSSAHFGVHFGAPKGQAPAALEILWPSGKRQAVATPKAGQVIKVKEEQ